MMYLKMSGLIKCGARLMAAVVCVSVLAGVSMRAEVPGTGKLSGTVTASQAFTAAQVYIRNVDLGIVYMVYTNQGRYRAVALFPGNYEVSVSTKHLESDTQTVTITAGEPAEVEGSAWKWRVDPEAIAALGDDPGGRVAILNPYDRMLFDRPRLAELFDFEFILEQFKPKAQRVYGYFVHPILIGDRFSALMDAELDKKKENLVVSAVHELIPFDDEEREMVDAEIRDLGEWLGVPVVFASGRR